jgi:hypothetical protein
LASGWAKIERSIVATNDCALFGRCADSSRNLRRVERTRACVRAMNGAGSASDRGDGGSE